MITHHYLGLFITICILPHETVRLGFFKANAPADQGKDHFSPDDFLNGKYHVSSDSVPRRFFYICSSSQLVELGMGGTSIEQFVSCWP